MPKGTNQKLKLLYLMKIFLEQTDDNHAMTTPELIAELEKYDITAERKSIYSDIDALREYGLDIIKNKEGKDTYYRVGDREFQLPELKLLVDAVQSSKFITEKKSNELIKKIESLTSRYEAKDLQHQVYVLGRVKTSNEKIYYSVDTIHEAIRKNVKVRFQYFQWSVDKQQVLRRDGAFYCISPWALTWDDENYYMIGFDSQVNKIKHYRVDKMKNLSLVEGERREGQEHFGKFNMARYAKQVFSMFGGELQRVSLEFENNLAGAVIDRFGHDIIITKKDDNHFAVSVEVEVSPQFLAWVIALGAGAKVVAPERVVAQMRAEAKRLMEMYNDESI